MAGSKLKITLITILLPIINNVTAQNTFSGRVLDETKNPIPYANIVLYALPDTTFIEGTVSNPEGDFLLKTNKSGDLIKISYIGYKTLTIASLEFSPGDITMLTDDNELGEIEIKALLPKTQLKGTSRFTKIEGTILEKSGTAKDVLEKIPGIINNHNEIEVIGKGKPLIFINGREVYDSKQITRIMSDAVQDIEVIINPGPEYPADAKSVVKITTRKRQGDGLGFDTEIHHSQEINYGLPNPGAALNGNFRHNNLDIFAGIDFQHNHERDYAVPIQNTYTSKHYYQISNDNYETKNNVLNTTLGTNYQIGKNHFIGTKLELQKDLNNNVNDDFSSTVSIDNIVSDNLTTIQNDNEKPQSSRINLYYNATPGKWNIDLNLDNYNYKNSKTSKNNETSNSKNEIIESESKTFNNILAAKLILSYPLWNGSLSIGTELTNTNRNSKYQTNYLQLPESDSKVNDNTMSYFFDYEYNINEKTTAEIGLRYEKTNYNYNDYQSNDDKIIYKNDYLYPSASFTTNLFDKIDISLAYSIKTKRPDYTNLDNTVNYINRYTFQSGNAKLKNAIYRELSLNLASGFFNFSTSFEHTHNEFSQWGTPYNNEGTVMMQAVNFNHPVKLLSAFANFNPTFGAYTMDWTAGISKQWLKLKLTTPEGELEKEFNKPIFIASLNNSLAYNNGWQFDADFNLLSKGNTINWEILNNYSNMDISVQKSLLNNALRIKLSYENLLGTYKNEVLLNCGMYQLIQYERGYKTRIMISLRYIFNHDGNRYKGTGAGDETIDRI